MLRWLALLCAAVLVLLALYEPLPDLYGLDTDWRHR